MSDQETPQPGDVWVRRSTGHPVFITKEDGLLIAFYDDRSSMEVESDFAEKFCFVWRLRKSPQPQGETITVECAVTTHDDGSTVVIGREGMTAEQTKDWYDYLNPMRYTVSLVIPKPAVPVLPSVTVGDGETGL